MIMELLNLSAAQSSGKAEKADLGVVVAFGDSITRGYGVSVGTGWVEMLPELLKEKGKAAISVFNAGGNGNTSAEGLKRIQEDVLSHMPGLVLVEFGGNDAVHDARAVSVDEFEKNILEIKKQVTDKGGKIVLVTFPPVVNEWHAWKDDPYYSKWGGLDQCVEQYRQRTRDLAKRLGCPLFDLNKILREAMKSKGREIFISLDGIHLTEEGNKLVAEEAGKFIVANKVISRREKVAL
jgi:lysophospholipase L1-like esterase